MTGYESKRAAAQDKLAQPAQESTLQEKDRKRGSIALARSLCYKINGAADDSDDMDGGGYGSVDIAEILSAEVVRLQAALAQPEQEPVEDVMLYHDDGTRIVRIAAKRPWVGLTDAEIEDLFQSAAGADEETHIRFALLIQAKLKERNA